MERRLIEVIDERGSIIEIRPQATMRLISIPLHRFSYFATQTPSFKLHRIEISFKPEKMGNKKYLLKA